jgi:hypothetical protein
MSPGRTCLLAVAALIAMGGCGYRLAGHNQLLPPSVKIIAVPPFENQTRRPEIEQRITEQTPCSKGRSPATTSLP